MDKPELLIDKPIIMIRISQRDERWGDVTIGMTNVKMKTDGCLITSIAMLRTKFFRADKFPYIRPDEFAKGLTFNMNAELIWSKSDFEKYGMEFVWRQYNYFPSIHDADLKAYCENPDYGVLVQVLTYKGKKHWITLVGRSAKNLWLGWATNDSWDAKRLWKTVGWKGRYVRITGFVVLKKHEVLEKMRSGD